MAEIGKIQKREITEEMKESYIDYAMSVIVSRALPDVRDGLKPVHRRILYTMGEDGLRHDAKFRKSATVVGNTMSRFHPHGDVAIYDSLARMAQDFSLRYPLINGQGNWGSIDDSQAAMRYTECRLSKIGEELLKDIEKNTVNFIPNYDGTRKEPTVLPSPLPNLLLNGSMGIAVGMATNIPPHNLAELVEGICYLIDNPQVNTQDLFQFIKGPDFPTGGVIYNQKEIIQAYSQGKGPIITRGKAEILEKKKGGFQIIISEIPYQVQKSLLLEKIVELVKNKKLVGIKNVRDESDKEGLRIVIDLKSDAYPQKILNRLYKFTDLQHTFHLNLLSLVDGIQPRVLSLKDILHYYILHREEVVTRRTQFNLEKAKERSHILEGLKKALNRIDEVIKTIKESQTREDAKEALKRKFKFSDLQATAILEMKLQALAGLERKRVQEELQEKLKLIKEYSLILKSPRKILGIVKKELKELQKIYQDPRRTKVYVQKIGEMAVEDLIPEEETIITITKGGYIKRTSPAVYKIQRRGGKGIIGMSTRGEDIIEHFIRALTHDNLLFFTNSGKVFQIPVYEVPESPRIARGRAMVNFLELSPEEKVTAVLPLKRKEEKKYLVMATQNGIIKKVQIEKFSRVRKTGLKAITLNKGDSLEWVMPTEEGEEIILGTSKGMAIRFKGKEIRAMGRAAAGIRGIRLKKEDRLIGMDVINAKSQIPNTKLAMIAENGYGKRTNLKHYRLQRRGGGGIKTLKVTPKTGELVYIKVLISQEGLIVISQKGQVIRMEIKNIPTQGRVTQGVRIMRLGEGDKVASAICF